MNDIIWTQQSLTLWTGRRDGRPAGTIEHGSRYTYVDLDGERSQGFRRLADAQAAAEGVDRPRRSRAAVWAVVLPVLAFGCGGVVAVLAMALSAT